MSLSNSSGGRNADGRSFNRGYSAEPSTSTKTNSSRLSKPPSSTNSNGIQFDILAWYPKYQSCQRYFVDHAQHDVLVQAFASFINILLPFQREPHPIFTCKGARTAAERMEEIGHVKQTPHMELGCTSISLIPYIRRLVATGMDVPQILHGFFGNNWVQGIGSQREIERRNYLLSARSGDWLAVKRDYDMLPLETVPFLAPLKAPLSEEIEGAEKSWKEWSTMQHNIDEQDLDLNDMDDTDGMNFNHGHHLFSGVRYGQDTSHP